MPCCAHDDVSRKLHEHGRRVRHVANLPRREQIAEGDLGVRAVRPHHRQPVVCARHAQVRAKPLGAHAYVDEVARRHLRCVLVW